MRAPEILHGSHLSFFLPSLMASMMVDRPMQIMAMLHMMRYCQGLFTLLGDLLHPLQDGPVSLLISS